MGQLPVEPGAAIAQPAGGRRGRAQRGGLTAEEQRARLEKFEEEIKDVVRRLRGRAVWLRGLAWFWLFVVVVAVAAFLAFGVSTYVTETPFASDVTALKAQQEAIRQANQKTLTEDEKKVGESQAKLPVLAREVAAAAVMAIPPQSRRVIGQIDSDVALINVNFADPAHGWAVGDNGTILATSDGGASWAPQKSGTSEYLVGVHFADPAHGWAVGRNGTILATRSGGQIWDAYNSATRNGLFQVFFADPLHGWAVGQNATVVHWGWRDVSGITQATTSEKLRAVLLGLGVKEESVGPELNTFDRQTAEVADFANQVDRDRALWRTLGSPQAGVAQAKKPEDAKENRTAGFWQKLSNPTDLLGLADKIYIAVVFFFAVSILLTIYRYLMRLSAHYDACADALQLAELPLGPRFHALVQSLSPQRIDFGKLPNSPIDNSLDAIAKLLDASARIGRK